MHRRLSAPIIAALAVVVAAAQLIGLVVPQRTWAHGAEIKAFVTLDPPVPVAGQHHIRVELLDFYDNPIPGAKLQAGVGAESAPVPLREIDLGVHRGTIRLPDEGRTSLSLEATLPDGPWFGQTRLIIGPETRAIQRTLLGLRHRDERLLTPAGMALLGVIAFAVLLRVVLGGGFAPQEKP